MTTDAPVRAAEVALSAPALAQQWARQEAAPAGAAVVAHREIAGRGRGGIEWREEPAVAISVIARPADLVPSSEELTWLAASLAAVDTIAQLGWAEARPSWPDVIPLDDGSISVLAETTLRPARVDLSVLTLRVATAALADERHRDQIAATAVACLRRWASALDHPVEIVEEYRSRCSTLGQTVVVHRFPSGSARGMAHDVTDTGALVIRSATGLEEPLPVASIRSVELINP